jgi:nitric oxide reductase activation protein
MGTLCSKRLQQPMVLVLTDGIPSDVDVENDNYLLLDAQYAVAQLKDEGVAVNCLKIGSMQGQVCQQIFGIPHTVVCEADNIELAIRSVLKKIRKSFS